MQGYNVDYGVPFCESFLCISSNQSEDKVVLWECIPESCKTKLIGFMSLLFLLSVLTTAFNAAVLVINLSPSSRRVFGRNATMRNYSNYVISMSVTDLLIGAVVLPLAIALFSREMFSSREAEFIQNLVTVDPITNLTNQRNNFTFSQSNVEDFELKSTVNPFSDISKEHDESSKRGNSDILVQCLGFFTQLGVFVSMYTLTAASVDRFYVSKSAASDPSHYISSTSSKTFKIGISCGDHSFYPTIRPSRSATIVSIVWMLGLLLSCLPLGLRNDRGYREFGHMFVLISFDNFTLTLIWYFITLVIPLVLTWIFSGLLCSVLYRRKQRLKKCSRAFQRQEFSDRRTDEKEYDSSCAWTNRYSTTESPTLGAGNTDTSGHSDQDVKEEETSSKIYAKIDKTIVGNPKETTPLQRPSSLALLSTPPQRRRPNSFDVFVLNKNNKHGEGISGLKTPGSNRSKINGVNGHPKAYSFQNVQDVSVVKKALLKVSWDTASCHESSSDETIILSASPAKTRRNGNVQLPIRFADSPCSPAGSPKCEIVRNPYSRSRRRSSIFRAKEFMMSNTFESNVAKSLLAVVIALSFSILPILFMFPQLVRHENNFLSNSNTSFMVISTLVLLSNSLWNCLIYGARTRYFQTTLRRTFGKAFGRDQHRNSLSKQLSQIFSTKTSIFNNDSKI